MKLRLIISALALFIIALAFNILFNFTSFEKLYVETLLSQHRVFGIDLQRSIERGLRYGKQMENHEGMQNLLLENRLKLKEKVDSYASERAWKNSIIEETDVATLITDAEGLILYSDSAWYSTKRVPLSRLGLNKKNSSKPTKSISELQYTHDNQHYYSILPVKNIDERIVGYVVICSKDKCVEKFLSTIFKKYIKPVLLISCSGILLMFVLLLRFAPSETNKFTTSKRRTAIIIIATISSALILTCLYSTLQFKEYFLTVNKRNTATINKLLKRDVEKLLNTGVDIEKLSNLDIYLGIVISKSPEIDSITLLDHHQQPLYRATKAGVTDFQRSKDCYEEWVEATKPITDHEFNVRDELTFNGTAKGNLSTIVSRAILFEKLADVVLDSITVIVISLLLFVELMILFFKYAERRAKDSKNLQTIDYSLMRPAAFLFLFGIDMSVSFLPLHMENLYVPILSLTKETIMGLPISVEFLFVGIAILFSGIWLDRRGWHEPFLVGLIISAAGVFYSWAAPDALHFIFSRAIVGFGYGLSLMASQGYVITYSDWKNKAQGLAHLFAGIYAGSICGTATGGMLAEVIGYTPVFLVGCFILVGVVVYTMVFMRTGMHAPLPKQPLRPIENIKEQRFIKFLFNRTILGLIFFSSLPAAIAVVGFLNYFSPIYLNKIGASQSTIGQVIMLYGICLIYFGPYLSRYVDKSSNKKVYILLGCLLGSLALLTFYFFEGIGAAMIAVVLLGLSSSFVLASQSVYALRLKVTQNLGEGKAIGIFRSTSRVGQMLGPIVFGSIIAAAGIKSGIAFLGLAYLLTAALFLIVTQNDTQNALIEDK